MKKNEVYVLSQPSHPIVSIIYVDTEFPLEQKTHEALGKMSEEFDVILVYSDYHNSNLNNIDKNKFASLYQACCYIDSPGKSLGRSTFRIISYCREIFKIHVGFIFSRLSDISKVKESNIEKIKLISSSSITKPIYIERRLTNTELYKIYKKTEEISINNSVYWFFSGLYNKYIDKESLVDIYCIWHSSSEIMYFRPYTLDLFMKSPNFMYIVDTFEESDPRFMLASLTRKFNISVMNLKLEDIKL